jgi:glycosyltransferase involved in cell wall biosynthesis
MNAVGENKKTKLLILPSWYPSPLDKINGSFFQEQAKLVSRDFDVKVLLVRFACRPSIRLFFKKPVKTGSEWFKYLFLKDAQVQLPDDDVFINPPLIEYKKKVIGVTQIQGYKEKIDAYLKSFKDLLDTGWRPDIIHAHSVNMGGLIAKRIKDLYGIPYVITEHMPFALCNYPSYMREDIKRSFNSADMVLSLGYDKVRQLGMSGIDVEPNLVYNYVDDNQFSCLSDVYQKGSPLKLITIGAASHYKDHRTLLRSVQTLKERGVPFSLTMVGLKAWGGLYDETLNMIAYLGLKDDVIVVDSIKREKVQEYLADSHIYLMTSIAEGFPVSVLEAMACGLFVLSTRHGGTEDIMTEKVGRLVEIKNYKKIADYLEDIYSGKISYSPVYIRSYVISLCGREAFRRRLINYYNAVIRK